MFDSGVSVRSLIDDLKSEVDIALEIPDHVYVGWLNSLEQLLYSEVIRGQRVIALPSGAFNLGQHGVSFDVLASQQEQDEERIRFEDVHSVFLDEIQLIKTTLLSGKVFPNCYFKDGNNLGYASKDATPFDTLYVFYHVRPKVKPQLDFDNEKVMLPVEFIDLAKAKLRGEAYKLANEDALAAKWLNDYNVLLETFKAWIGDKSSQFGL